MSVVRFNAHKKYHLLQCKTRVWETHQATGVSHQVIIVRNGEGQFSLDGKLYDFYPQGVILLASGQRPIFQEDTNTEIFVISFDQWLAEDFQQRKGFSPDFANTYKQAERLCEGARLTQGRPIKNDRDAQTMSYLIDQIVFEATQQSVAYTKLISGTIDMMITILMRNNFESKVIDEDTTAQKIAGRIIDYLRGELHKNKSIRVPELLMKFDISEDTANLCVMNETGMSLRNFIHKYKADLFRSRLLKVDVLELSTYLSPNSRRFSA